MANLEGGGTAETKWKTLSLTHVEYPEGDKVYIIYWDHMGTHRILKWEDGICVILCYKANSDTNRWNNNIVFLNNKRGKVHCIIGVIHFHCNINNYLENPSLPGRLPPPFTRA